MDPKRNGWHETSAGLYYAQNSRVEFYDDWDHWRNGFCRLLEISQQTAKQIIEECVDSDSKDPFQGLSVGDKIERIKRVFRNNFKHGKQRSVDLSICGMTFDGRPPDTLFAHSISGNQTRMIVGNSDLQYAWQVDAATNKLVLAASINYDELYFQDPQQAHLGMRNYIADQDWRLEKARRQLRIVLSNGEPNQPAKTALDVGSAVGYFRKACAEADIVHYGLEQSSDAIKICADKFGFTSLFGEIADLAAIAPQLLGSMDIITMWDVLEHLDDGLTTINILKQFLSPTGVLVIRTPNLVSLEYDILGDYYYSFKLDHIKYYSPSSLNALARLCGLRRLYLETTSHMFKGLLGIDHMHQSMLNNKGADIIAIYSRSKP
jgi:2-polyprenyl-3-methyl-5-hydroxy-6-metoxy-1,4-benzoquinol methylase